MSSKPEIHTSGGGKEGAISRFFLAPLAFLSFILSLALIDSRNHYLRIANREPSSSGVIQRVRGFLHSVVFRRVDKGPYEYVRSPDSLAPVGTAGKVSAEDVSLAAGSPGRGASPGAKRGNAEGEPWHWHTKQRKMMKREFDDAFEMRNSVAVGIVAVLLGVLLGIAGLVGWIWGFVVGRFGGARPVGV